MRIYYLPFVTLIFLTACDQGAAPSVVKHPQSHRVNVDGHTIYVVPQPRNVWAASGGEDGKDGMWIQYRQERAIELHTKCRILKRVSKPGEPILKATVNRCP